MPNKELLVWCDLETTGLDPKENVILEVGVAVTRLDEALTPLFSANHVLPYTAADRAKASPLVERMHTNNGLWDECQHAAYNARAVAAIIAEHLQSLKDDDHTLYLAGNSVHFDRSFLAEHMPAMLKPLAYRQVDVSSIKVLAVAAGVPQPEKAEAHRALDDIRASQAELQYYRKHFFKAAV